MYSVVRIFVAGATISSLLVLYMFLILHTYAFQTSLSVMVWGLLTSPARLLHHWLFLYLLLLTKTQQSFRAEMSSISKLIWLCGFYLIWVEILGLYLDKFSMLFSLRIAKSTIKMLTIVVKLWIVLQIVWGVELYQIVNHITNCRIFSIFSNKIEKILKK